MAQASFLTLSEQSLSGKRVLIRADLNVPVSDGVVTSDARIVASVPTIQHALEAGASVVVMSHLGRPKEGVFEPDTSLAPVATRLSELLEGDVGLLPDIEACGGVAAGQVALLENVRCFEGEKADSDELAQRMAAQCDVFVMDAFGTAHRAQASTHGVGKFAPIAAERRCI